MRFFVTGGAGFIGSHITEKLLKDGHFVRVLDNFVYGDQAIAPLRRNPALEVIRGDISSVRDVVGAVKDVDGVIALAAIVGDPDVPRGDRLSRFPRKHRLPLGHLGGEKGGDQHLEELGGSGVLQDRRPAPRPEAPGP